VWNAEGRFQGQTDIDLDDTGRTQAERSARLLAALGPSSLVASDLRRSRDTAAALASVANLDVRHDAGLRETFAGSWQGLTAGEIERRHPEDWSAWNRGSVEVRPGGGETRVEVAERMVAAIGTALDDVPKGGTLVAATHGGAARVAICRLLGLPPEVWGSIGVLSNCCWSVLVEGRQGWLLVEHNAGTLPEPVLSEEG
jgi:probable phosphoglycerate mutase